MTQTTKKLLALAASDIHIHDWKQFNERGKRTNQTLNFLKDLIIISHEKKVPILIPGDFFHTPGGLSTRLICVITEFFKSMDRLYNYTIIGISGNHDLSEGYSLLTFLSTISSHIINIDLDSVLVGNTRIYGIPYKANNVGFDQSLRIIRESFEPEEDRILLIHTDLYGAKDPSGFELSTIQNLPRNMGEFFKGFDLVLSGHIHKFTEVVKGHIYMVGAPNQQRKSDANTEMGYLKIYDNFSVEFIPTGFSKFILYNAGEKPDDDYNFLIEIPKPKLLNINKTSGPVIKSTNSKVSLAKKYLKTKGIMGEKKLKFLIDVLQQTED